jgi:hypothetical protein
MTYIYSGVCLAAMFGAIFYERHQMKKEEAELCEKMRLLAEKTKSEMGEPPIPLPRDVIQSSIAQIH